MTNYPASIQSIPNPTSTDLLENATPELDHDYQHSTANDTIEALEAKVGVDGSAVTTSHDYKLGEVTGSDKAVGKTATQTLTNKTLTSPQINFGSDARGDLMYRNGSGTTARLPIGTNGQILSTNSSGDPEWISNPSASDASYTVKGVVKGDTDAATSGLTIASGVISVNSGTTANKIVKLDSSAKLPAVDGSQLTNIANPITYKNGVDTSRAGNASGSTQNIAHGLGKTPKRIRIVAAWSDGSRGGSSNNTVTNSIGTYNGTTNSNINWAMNSAGGYIGTAADNTYGVYLLDTTASQNYQRAVITCDSTNIILTWTTNGSLGSANTISLLWEAEA